MEQRLRCSICQEPFNKAVEVACCASCYCEQCLLTWLRSNPVAGCPNCRKPLNIGNWKENKPLQKLVDDLPEECPFKSNGCNAPLTRSIVAEHAKKCDFALVDCPNSSNCGKLLRKDLKAHLEDQCQYKPTPCSNGCGELISASESIESHLAVCPMVMEACTACSEMILRKDHATHYCPMRPIPCPFHVFGCTLSEKKLPSEIEQHSKENMEYHLSLMCRVVSQLLEEQKKLDEIVKSLQRENAELKQQIAKLSEAKAERTTISSPQPPPPDEIEMQKRANKLAEAKPVYSPTVEEYPAGTTSVETGIKVLMQLPQELQQKYSKLVSRPMLIIENLLMDERIEYVANLFEFMSSLRNDSVLIEYANKAMAMPNRNYEASLREVLANTGPQLTRSGSFASVPKLIPPPPQLLSQPAQSNNNRTMEWHLTGDIETDKLMRANHTYPNTPRSDLANKILALCADSTKAAYAGLHMFERFTGYLTGYFDYEENLKIARALRDILQHSKVLLMKNPLEAHSGAVEMCDTFVSHLDNVERIIQSRCPIQVQLQDLGDSSKARQIRDKLVDYGQFEVARDLSLKCQLALDHVWVSWGLQLLRDKKYQEARDIFSRVLTPVSDSSRAYAGPSPGGGGIASSGSLNTLRRRTSTILSSMRPPDTQRIVDSILQVLDPLYPTASEPNSSTFNFADTLDSYQDDVIASSSSKTSLGPEPKTINNEALRECTYYLEKFGSSKACVAFYVRHNMLETAIKFCIERQVTSEVFVDEVIVYSAMHGMFQDVKTIIKKLDPNWTSTRKYLLAACKFFNDKKAFKTLVTLQIFMEDYARAALTCIKLFIDTEDPHYKMKCLEVAKEYFEEALRLLNSPRGKIIPSVLSAPEIERNLDKIQIQTEFMHYLIVQKVNPQILASVKSQHPGFEQYSVFGPPLQRQQMAAFMLASNTELGLRLVMEIVKPEERADVLKQAAQLVARNLTLQQCFDYLKAIKLTFNTGAWIDMTCVAMVEVFSKEKNDYTTAEKIAAVIESDLQRVDALVSCGKLKAAYLAAVRCRNVQLVKKIQDEAVKSNDTSVAKLCEKYLALNINQEQNPSTIGQGGTTSLPQEKTL